MTMLYSRLHSLNSGRTSLIYTLRNILVMAITLVIIAGCGGGSSSPGSNSGTGSGTSLGTLPNGSTIYISSSSFTAASNESTTGILSISGGTPGASYTFSFNITPTSSPSPFVESNPSPCVLTSGSSQTSCQLNFVGNGAPESSYNITLSAESTGASTQDPLGSFTFRVTGGSAPTELFTCVADLATSNSCGCLLENDGSGLLWYADATESGTWKHWCTESLDTDPIHGNQCTSSGESIVAFNSGSGHCGYTDWHLPTIAASTTSGSTSAAGGNWGALASYAESNGYTSGNNLNIWLENNNFITNTSFWYWASVSASGASAYLSESTGEINTAAIITNAAAVEGVLLVRHN